MSKPKELRAYFREAPWTSQAEIDALAEELGAVPPAEIGKLIEVLVDHGAMGSAAQHRMRCAAFAAIAAHSLTRDLFVPLVNALPYADSVFRALIVELLPKVNNAEEHGALCAALGPEDPDVRAAAAQVLGRVGGAHALEALVRAVEDKNFAGRIDALNVMVPRARHHALPLVEAVLRVGNPPDRARAVRWLADKEIFAKKPESERALELAQGALDDPHARVAGEAVRTYAALVAEDDFVARVGTLADSPDAMLQQSFVEALALYPTQRTIDTLAKILHTAHSTTRLAAVVTLETIGIPNVVPALVHALGDKQLTVRTRARDAVLTLNRDGKVELARTVLWLLRSRDPNMRRMAAEIAREVGDPKGELIPSLLRFLRDEDWWVRERVIDALAQIAGLRLTDHVLPYLKDPSDVVRRYAVGAMRRVHDPRALGPLMRCALDDVDWWVREEAIGAAAELGDARAVPYLLQVLQKDSATRLACVAALRKLEAREALPAMVELLSHEEPAVRLGACKFVGELGSPDQAPPLAQLAADRDLRVRKAAAEALLRWNIQHQTAQLDPQSIASPLDRLLIESERQICDDLMLTGSRPPHVKRMGQVVALSPNPISEADLHAMLMPILTVAQRQALERLEEVDCSYHVRSHDLRFRANIFHQMAGLSAVFRSVKNRIPNIDTIGVPDIVKSFGDLRNGLVLVGGPASSGKSTTLAALLDYINRTHCRHIVTIEDPIEVIHAGNQSLFNQRETGSHTRSFERALRSAMRQDPDVLLIGELRDYETVSFALAAAETGHLVFGTVHTVSADNSIDRIINTFPPGQRPQMRSMLADTLRAVVCQNLLRRTDRPGERVIAVEIMINTDAIANLIRKDKGFQIPSVIATGRDHGMLSMDASLLDLVTRGIVHPDEAFMRATDKKQFDPTLADAGPAQPMPAFAEPLSAGARSPTSGRA